MRGWTHLWAAADIIRPALVVIDPALDACTGDPNNLAAVREFVSALGASAAGVLPAARRVCIWRADVSQRRFRSACWCGEFKVIVDRDRAPP